MIEKINDTADAPTRRPTESDDAVQTLLDGLIIERSARLIQCLNALKQAGVPLDMNTADCLVELGERMVMLIREALEQAPDNKV